MFSRAEREYLRLVAEGPRGSTEQRLEGTFPNPVYRRKLRWGIRHKASRSLVDWRLYAAAAHREVGLLPATERTEGENPPLYADSIVTLLGALRQRFPRSDPRGAPSDPAGRR